MGDGPRRLIVRHHGRVHRHDRLTHTQRDRAESFGRVAADYDRYRPSYPARLIDELLRRGPRTALDIGCGTGKAARLFAERGLSVMGVEVDPQMAEVARAHGLAVEVGRFEDWDDAGRRFDLITAAQAWHWVDPQVGAEKAARLLNPGGELALFWNFAELSDEDEAVVDSVYRRLAPEMLAAPGAGQEGLHRRRLEESGCFRTIEALTYPAEHVSSVEEWVGQLGTQSNHLLLGPRLPALLDEMRQALQAARPHVRTIGGSYLIRARV
jgi:SAM-dependent methyltransferase